MAMFDKINYQPLDTSTGLDKLAPLYLAARKASGDLRKQSADMERSQWEMQRMTGRDAHADQLDADKRVLDAEATQYTRGRDVAKDAREAASTQYTKDIAAGEQMLPNSDLMRAARASAELGNAVGKPHGISFIKKPEVWGGTGPAPEGPLPQHLFSTFRGQQAEVPLKTTPVFAEPDLESAYQGFIEAGLKPEAAQAKVVTMRGQNIGAAGRAGTLAARKAELEQKKATQLTREEQAELAQLRADTSIAGARIGAGARLGAASIMAGAGNGGDGFPGLGKEQAAGQNSLNQRMTQIRQVSSWNKLVEMDKTAEILLHDIETGTVPLQNREAQVLAAKIIRGRVTNEEMHQLFDNIGGAGDAFNRLAQGTLQGKLTDEQLRQLRISTNVILDQHRMAVRRAAQVAKAGLMPYYRVMPEQAQAAHDMFSLELGLPSEDLGAVDSPPPPPAAGPAPAPAPAARPRGHGAPARAPAPVPPKAKVETRPGPDGKTYYKVQGGWTDQAP